MQGYMRGLPKPGSMSEAAPILIQLKQWQEKTLEMGEHDRAQGSDDDIQKRIQNMSILQTCPPSSTAGQQSGGSAAAVDDPTHTCTETPSSRNDAIDSKDKKGTKWRNEWRMRITRRSGNH